MLTSIAAQRGSAVRLIDRDFSYTSHAPAHRLDYHGLGLELRDLELGLAGPFQHENAAIAVATLEALRAQGWRIDEDAIRRGIAEIYWPGRFDIVSHRPLVILDCAHNEMSIAALLETMSVELGPVVKPRLVFGCQSAKEWSAMAAMLAPRVRDVTLTRAKPKSPLEPEELRRAFRRALSRARRARPDARDRAGDVRNGARRRGARHGIGVSYRRSLPVLSDPRGASWVVS